MPAQRGYDLTHHAAVQAAITGELRPRTARLAHMASDLLEKQLQAMLAMVEEDPAAASKLPTKELRSLLASNADKLLPPPRVEADHSPIPSASIEEPEARLAEAKRIASEYATVIEAEPAEDLD